MTTPTPDVTPVCTDARCVNEAAPCASPTCWIWEAEPKELG